MLAASLRDASDYLTENVSGTRVKLLRITKESLEAWSGNSGPQRSRDILGGYENRLQWDIIGNVTVKYPGNKLEIFAKTAQWATVTTAVNPQEQLPIEFIIQFKGAYNTTVRHPMEGDIFVDYFKDENANAIPIFLQVKRLFAGTSAKNIIRKTGELVPFVTPLEPELVKAIKPWLASVG